MPPALCPVYALEGVSTRREKSGAVFILEVPRLHVGAGEFIAFVGESGCGKSTLLDLLGLVSRASSAARFEIVVGDAEATDVHTASDDRLADLRRRHLGYVLQNGGLLPFLTAGENILLPRRVNGQAATRAEVEPLLSTLRIGDQWSKKPAFLSGGQRQRVAIARALAHAPALVLADEPTGAVDKLTAREIRDLLREAARARGATVLIVTHDETLLSGQTDRVFTFDVRRVGENEVHSTLKETNWQERRTPSLQ